MKRWARGAGPHLYRIKLGSEVLSSFGFGFLYSQGWPPVARSDQTISTMRMSYACPPRWFRLVRLAMAAEMDPDDLLHAVNPQLSIINETSPGHRSAWGRSCPHERSGEGTGPSKNPRFGISPRAWPFPHLTCLLVCLQTCLLTHACVSELTLKFAVLFAPHGTGSQGEKCPAGPTQPLEPGPSSLSRPPSRRPCCRRWQS